MRAVAGLEPADTGTITWDGTDLAGVPTHKRGFALMFQDGQLFSHLTVSRNVGYALRLRRAPRIAERVEELVAYRTAELRHTDESDKEDRADVRRGNSHRFALGIVSLGAGIPISGIAASYGDVPGLMVAWAGIVGVNAVFAWGNRARRRS